MLYSLSLSFLYQCDKEAVLLWIVGMIPLELLYCISDHHASNDDFSVDYTTIEPIHLPLAME